MKDVLKSIFKLGFKNFQLEINQWVFKGNLNRSNLNSFFLLSALSGGSLLQQLETLLIPSM